MLIFSNFPPMIWIFMEGEGDEIKSKQASKRDRTLPVQSDISVQMIVFDCLNDTTLLIWNLELESRIMKDFHIFFFMRNLFESFEKWIHSLRSDVICWGGKDKNWIEPTGSHSGFCNQKVLPSSLFTSTMRFWHTTDFEVSKIL